MKADRAEGVRVAYPLFQAGGGGSTPTSALQLWFRECSIGQAITLNRLWHSRLPRVVYSNIQRCPQKVCYVAEGGDLFYATAIWTNPIAMLLPQREWLELRRLAIAPDAPKNTATRMIGWMARDIRQRFPGVTRLISYQDCDVHTGTIYAAAGWVATVQSKDHRNRGLRSGRKRNLSQTTATKQRWEKVLVAPEARP
jgi:hypothetical protein